jgi:alkylation response protein AidB-like acyl-CoA dehydrogenase
MPVLSRQDLDFLLYDWLGVESLTTRPRFAEHSRETFDAALDTYETIATEQFAPHNKKNDQQEPRFDGERVQLIPEVAPALRAFCEAGLMAAAQDAELGGMQLPYVVERAGFAFLLAANVATAAYPFLTMGNANLLQRCGSPDLVRRFVPALLQGRFFGTMCLSEPSAGSSLADITTRAERQRDGRYRLLGNKMWISGGEHDLTENIVHLVLAKVPDEHGKLRPGVGGISLFVVPKRLVNDDGTLGERNDVVLGGLNHKMGYRGTANCLLNFGEGRFRPEGLAGAIGLLVGEEGKGLNYMFHMMNEARIGVGLGAAALGYTGYLHALDYARTRRQGRRPGERDPAQPPATLMEHADVRRMLLAQKSYVEGGLALVLYAARLVDEVATGETTAARHEAGLLLDLLTPIAKSWPSQWCLAANDLAIQVHGGYGYTRDFNVEQFYRDNRLNPIHEGTHGIQAIDLLGRKVGAAGGASLALLGARMETTMARARQTSELGEFADALQAAWGRLRRVTQQLESCSNVTERLANATPYLEAFGHVVVAWLWLEQALAAQTSETTSGLCRGKEFACRYFFRWELPRVEAWIGLLDPVETTPLEMRDAFF